MSPEQIKDYINIQIAQSFEHFNAKSCRAVIQDNSGNILLATTAFAKFLGFSTWDALVGLNLKSICAIQIPALKNANPSKTKSALEFLHKVAYIQSLVIREKSPLAAIILHPFYNQEKTTYLLQFIPIATPTGEVVGTLIYSTPFKLFGIQELLQASSAGPQQVSINPKVIDNLADLPIQLSLRQFEIIFLIAIGMSQRDAAEVINISRGTLSKMLSEVICPKFNIFPPNSEKLIAAAQQLNFHNDMPLSLCRPWTLILRADFDLIERYRDLTEEDIWKIAPSPF